MLVQNSGDRDDRLLHAVSPIAERIEIHRTHLVNGAREMDAVQEGLAIPAGMTVVLEPASYHLMLFGLREDLVQGELFPLTLCFAGAGDVDVTARVRRKVDAAGVDPIPAVVAGDMRISLVSAPPAPAG
jgi:copper(I)-binding protein